MVGNIHYSWNWRFTMLFLACGKVEQSLWVEQMWLLKVFGNYYTSIFSFLHGQRFQLSCRVRALWSRGGGYKTFYVQGLFSLLFLSQYLNSKQVPRRCATILIFPFAAHLWANQGWCSIMNQNLANICIRKSKSAFNSRRARDNLSTYCAEARNDNTYITFL